MITTIDRGKDGNDWAMIDWDNDEIVYDESGERKPMKTSHFVFTVGKYKGQKLSEVNSLSYLQFLKDKNPDDYLVQVMFERRIKELK